jgi:hypothetical protein
MNHELPPDWLENALAVRAVMTAPPDFAESVLMRLQPRVASSPLSDPWMDYGLVAGITLALLGVGSLFDVGQFGELVAVSLQAPSPFLVAAVGFCATAVWVSLTADDTP